MIQSFAGFTFINMVNLKLNRKNPFFSARERFSEYNPFAIESKYSGKKPAIYEDIKTHMMVSFVLYFTTA